MVVCILAAQIGEKIATAEALGSGGELDECLKIMQEVEKIKLEKQSAEEEYRGTVPMSSQQAQKLRVCEVCSAYLSLYDNDRRLADHFGGKLHLGFVNVRDKIAELKQSIEEKIRNNKPKVSLYQRRRRFWDEIEMEKSRSPRRRSISPPRGSSRHEKSGTPISRDDRRGSPTRRHRHRHRSSSDERSYERHRSSRDKHKRSRHSRSRSHDRSRRSRRHSRSRSRDRSRRRRRRKDRHSHRRDSRDRSRHRSGSDSRERSHSDDRDRRRSRSEERNRRGNSSHSD